MYHTLYTLITFLALSLSLSLSLAPPLEEEPEDDASDSSSDDEKGGTISESHDHFSCPLISTHILHYYYRYELLISSYAEFKPKLRHVAVKKVTRNCLSFLVQYTVAFDDIMQ